MNILKAVAAAAPRVERAVERGIERGSERPVRTARPEGDRQLETTAGTDTRRVSRAEFSAVLALLSGVGSQVRADLMQQLPAEGVSIIDKLLDDAAGELVGEMPTDAVNTTALDQQAAQGIIPQHNPPGRAAATTSSPDRVAQRAAQDASEALRYGVLNATIASDAGTGEPAADIIDLPTYAKTRGLNGLAGLARAAERISGQPNADMDRNALAVLSRIATSRGSSLEQLLAVGDVRGADARAALDALLSKAGTPAGAEIAETGAGQTATAMDAMATATALAAANARSAADPASPVKDLDAVAPALRSRVQRVIERMKGEYGHDVTIVESARSQARQDALFEQGRTRPGQVVTWTRDSAHTRGEAVDVVVDGSWDNAQGFARLQRIAKEEGLHTLGMKDPGHLELAEHGARAMDRAAPRAVDSLNAAFTRQAASATPAAAASVAQVAGVAQVARVADAANAAPPALGDGAAASLAQTTVTSGRSGESNGNAFGRGERDEQGKPLNNGRKLGLDARHAAGDTSAYGATQGAASGVPSLTGAERASTVGGTAGSEQAQRVSDIQAMRADAPAGPLSRMTLNVENANGTQDRITVDLRGNVVDTFISTDASSAERMRLRTGELQESLSRHGLDAESVRISGTAKPESADASRSLGSERDALRMGGTTPTMSGDGAQGQSMRERATDRAWDKQQEARREQQEQADREQQRQQASQRDWQTLFNGTQK